MSAEGQNTINQIVTDYVIDALDRNIVPWHIPWAASMPRSMATGAASYRGINLPLLALYRMDGEYVSNWWGTIKKINALGGKVRKDEHGHIVIFWKRVLTYRVNDDTGERERYYIPLLRFYKEWNADQTEGLPERYYIPPEYHSNGEIDAAQQIQVRYLEDNPGLRWTNHDARAYYSPGEDIINVPPVEAHESAEAYYSTAFHEIIHSTGHPSRLNIPESGMNHFGDALYSEEELRAEMGNAMLLAHAGIEVQFEQSAAYVKNWLTRLENDNKLVVKAAARAQRAVDLVRGVTFEEES